MKLSLIVTQTTVASRDTPRTMYCSRPDHSLEGSKNTSLSGHVGLQCAPRQLSTILIGLAVSDIHLVSADRRLQVLF